MFHRVKSEDDKEPVQASTPAQSQQDAQEETRADITEFKAPQAEPEGVRSEAGTQVATPTNTVNPPEEEDQETMTDQDKTATEQEDSTPAAVGAYQRPGQAPVRAAGGYPGAYPGMGASDAASDSDRRLTIGPGITMSGEIESCDYLLVEGTVEAALKGADVLEIAESGTFYGTVEINEANISGRFEGDITVSGRLTVSSTGTVTGSISYKEIALEAGAVIDGKLTPLTAPPAAAKKPTPAKAAKPAPAPKAEKVEKQPEPANSDEGLFSKAAAAAE